MFYGKFKISVINMCYYLFISTYFTVKIEFRFCDYVVGPIFLSLILAIKIYLIEYLGLCAQRQNALIECH